MSKSKCQDLLRISRDLIDFKGFLGSLGIHSADTARAYLGDNSLSNEELHKKLFRNLVRATHPDIKKDQARNHELVKKFLDKDAKPFFPQGFNAIESTSTCKKHAFDLWAHNFKNVNDPVLLQRFHTLNQDTLEALFSRVDKRDSQTNEEKIRNTKLYEAAIKQEYGHDPFNSIECGIVRLKAKGVLPSDFELAEKKYSVAKVDYVQPKSRAEYMVLVKKHLPYYASESYVSREYGVPALKAVGVVSPSFKLEDCSVHYNKLASHYFPHNHAQGMTMARGIEKLKKHWVVDGTFQCPEVMTYAQCKIEYDTQKHMKSAKENVVFSYALPSECGQFDLSGDMIQQQDTI
jgi:hypothetical protein